MINAKEIPFKKSGILEGTRHFLAVSDGNYRLELPDMGVTFTAVHVRRNFGALVADVTVTTTLAGARTINGVLAAESMDLSRRADRSRLAAFLAQRSGATDLDWVGAVEWLCVSVIDAERSGDPAIVLKSALMPEPETAWDVCGIPILKRHPTILFGQGGEGKSIFALYVAGKLAQMGIPVLYADWELEAPEHRARFRQLFGAAEPPEVAYLKCRRPLVEEMPRIAEQMHAHSCQYIVCDSVVFGVSGPPEKAEVAAAYYRALRTLNVGSLLIAHTTKGTHQPGHPEPDEKPFGSVFWTNGCRSLWLLKKESDADERRNYFDVGLFHKKTNLGRLLRARGLRFTLETTPGTSFVERMRIEPMDLSTNEELAAKLPTWERIKRTLAKGPLTVDDLAEELDAPKNTIRKTVAGKTGLFEKRGDLVTLRGSIPSDAEAF